MSHRRKRARPTNKHWNNSTDMFAQSGLSADEDEDILQSSAPAIEIPRDIFRDFEELKHATNLDTTTLMRNLLKEYHKETPGRPWHQTLQVKSDDLPVMNDKDVMKQMVDGNDDGEDASFTDSGFLDTESQCNSDTEMPLDLSKVVKSRAGFYNEIETEGCREATPVVRAVKQQPNQLVSLVTTNVHLTQLARQGGMVMASSLPSHCNLVMSSAMPATNEQGECNIMMPVQMSMQLPTVASVDSDKRLSTTNIKLEGQACPQPQSIFAIPILQAVTGGVAPVSMQAMSQPVQTTFASQVQSTIGSPVQYVQSKLGQAAQAQPALASHMPTASVSQATLSEQPTTLASNHTPARRGRKPGSVNKGTKPAKPIKGNDMKVIAENTMFPGVYTSILKLPWSRRSRTKAHPPAPPVPRPQPSQPAPVNNSVSASTTGDNTASPATTQSVMMVYPNATISALGKPVRKRGRPPKLPVLSHLLSEKRPRKDQPSTLMTTGVSSQSASSVSADGSMLSILNTHSIGTESVLEDTRLKQVQSKCHTEDLSELRETRTQQFNTAVAIKSEDVVHTNAVNKDSDGSMFQEMILSSKSLINIKPRKRQAGNVPKSGDNFICTSFRIRPRASQKKPAKEKKNHSPKESVPVPLLDNSHTLSHIDKTNLDSITMSSPTSIIDSSPLSKNMFHELYHCKVCNEIVPAEDKQTHKQQHMSRKFFCLTCGLEYYSFLQDKCEDDAEAPESFQCEKCSESHKSSLSLTAALQLKRKSLQCDICNQQFKTYSEYCQHRREEHEDDKVDLENFPCDQCGKVFFTELGLTAHTESHIQLTVKCLEEDCNVLCVDEEDLDDHMDEVHNKKEYTCVYDGCKKKFIKKFHLQEHVRVKHLNIRAYRCSWPGCCKEFAAERHLKVHILIHKDEKPLKCEFCDYRCRQRNAMNWHMRKHPEAPYRYKKFGMLSGCDD